MSLTFTEQADLEWNQWKNIKTNSLVEHLGVFC